MSQRDTWIGLALIGTIAFAAVAPAEELHYDVFVTASGTTLVVGGFDDDAGVATIPVDQMRVFGGHVVGSGTAVPYESEEPGEPGFRAGTQAFLNGANTTPSGTYTALPGGVPLTFNFQPITVGAATRNLFFWDGSGTVNFGPVGSDVVLGLKKYGPETWTASISGTTAAMAAGNIIQTTSANSVGQVHTHLFTSISKTGAAPDQGFYLFSLELGMTGYASSESLYFVYGALDPLNLAPQFTDLADFEEAHGLAEVWVETNLVAVPEPSSMMLAGCGVLGLVGIGLRRRMARAAR